MKRLTIIRHAKSSWKDTSLPNVLRPLNKRGKRDAPVMDERLARREIEPDAFICSPAARALATAEIIAQAISYPSDEIVVDDRMHGAGLFDLLEIVQGLDDSVDCALLLGHNPGLSELVDYFSPHLMGISPRPGSSCSYSAQTTGHWSAIPSRLKPMWTIPRGWNGGRAIASAEDRDHEARRRQRGQESPQLPSVAFGLWSLPGAATRPFATLEVRWFRRGTVPRSLLHWFCDCEREPERAPRRIDHYLRLPSAPRVGIKLREGYLETKVLGQVLAVVQVHARMRGAVERWNKWRFALAVEAGAASLSPRLSPSWVGVSKERLLRRYALTSAGQVVQVEARVYPSRGCNLELTRVEVAGDDWWTVCFEAHGDEALRVETLSRVAEHALATREPPYLDEAGSFGYPAWLDEIG